MFPWYHAIYQLTHVPQQLKQNIWDLQQTISIRKSRYSEAMRRLEVVSMEIHESRRTRQRLLLNFPREPGVGAETDSLGSSISDVNIGELLGWLADWLAGWLTGWMDGWMVGWMDGWLVGWMAGWLVGWMTGWLDDWLDGWRDGWLTGWLAGWMEGWLADWLAGWRDGWMDGWMDGWLLLCSGTASWA